MDKKRKAVAAAVRASNTFRVVAQEFLEKLDQEGIARATSFGMRLSQVARGTIPRRIWVKHW
jgi:hypothetical protein